MNMAVRTVKSYQELETLRSFWERYQNHPNNDFDHYQLVCRLRQDFVTPHVAIIERDGEISAALVARIEKTRFSPAIGYFQPLRIPTKILTVLYQGLIGNTDEKNSQLFVRHLWSFLETRQVDMVALHNLPEHSSLLKALESYCPRMYFKKATKGTTHWTMALPEQPGFILKNMRSKHRSWIRSRQKKLEAAYTGNVSWQWMRSFDDIANITARLEVLAARTYQRGLGAGFVNDEEHRQRYRLFADRGQLRVYLVEIEGKVKAFWIGTVYQGVFHSSATGYDPDLSAYELGTLMFIAMADELVREGVGCIDFGLGDAFYKERFGDQSWQETMIYVFAPNIKGIIFRLIQECFNMLDNVLRRLLQKSGTLNRVKSGLRRLAQRRTKAC